jgi:hypothetical protein
VWLQILIENVTPRPADWSQTAEVQSDGETIATSDYSRSTPLPMSLPEGRQIGGWIWVGPDSRIPKGSPLTVRFRNVAVDGYHRIGDVVIATPLC